VRPGKTNRKILLQKAHRLENNGLPSNRQSHRLENNGLASDRTEGHGLPSARQSHSQSQVILEAVLALTMLVLFLLGAMAILKSAQQLSAVPPASTVSGGGGGGGDLPQTT